ncbi:hypothetical protein [Micromonospora sp. NPDC005171]|uniref:hypothetical protein n=1 Tax=Micromonospora sp. NPDC005171 TaxID=3156866 RepID=UPI0033AB90AE
MSYGDRRGVIQRTSIGRSLSAIVLIALLLSGCGDPNAEDVQSVKGGTIERAKILGPVEEGYWVDDSSVDGRVPGPNEVWKEGVARLADQPFQKLRSDYEWVPVETYWKPPIRTSLEGKIGFGSEWFRSAEFDAAAATDSDLTGSYYIEAETRGVIFVLKSKD